MGRSIKHKLNFVPSQCSSTTNINYSSTTNINYSNSNSNNINRIMPVLLTMDTPSLRARFRGSQRLHHHGPRLQMKQVKYRNYRNHTTARGIAI